MVQTVGLLLGLALTLVAVVLHFARGTGWQAGEDISREVLERRAATVPETDFPEPYNRGVGGGGGVPAEAIAAGDSEGELEESEEESGFDPEAIEEVEYYEIEFAKEGQTIEVANNETILEAGEDEDWDLPYSCRQGQCLSCAGHIDDGPAEEFVRHSNNDTLSEEEMDNGYCLTCVAYPTAEFTIKTGEQP
ncbi:2Fe-2S iron-sulfur cluster-binding protein [Halapricum hydrolyticum]|uniref:2Fe-2S iron-sulfur cluster-binding protein n=1 Tax=Halapricum hydrolyticum TaxID=2979991 RepID=A0AAE3LFF3_9EURY|nr:2Fe-2S iron-sulfur cluster-binding protein [Halapricum hydrolyticum]MCU4719160.1 2Fe-2S iron-sulfur cluster-binding protein [Halapricum hydrolyticum]MCU4727350.1 2Fe-2S iron-sulfur cluster-binding protein [Halapricum hydrolyticum]